MLNPKLNKGDRVLLLHMEGEMVSPGTNGVVRSITKDPFEKDGVIVYRFLDAGSMHYFTSRGETMSTKSGRKENIQSNEQ